jgi:hypothetical protein
MQREGMRRMPLLRRRSCGEFIPRQVNQPAHQNLRRPKLARSLQTGSRLDHRTLVHLLSLPISKSTLIVSRKGMISNEDFYTATDVVASAIQ